MRKEHRARLGLPPPEGKFDWKITDGNYSNLALEPMFSGTYTVASSDVEYGHVDMDQEIVAGECEHGLQDVMPVKAPLKKQQNVKRHARKPSRIPMRRDTRPKYVSTLSISQRRVQASRCVTASLDNVGVDRQQDPPL